MPIRFASLPPVIQVSVMQKLGLKEYVQLQISSVHALNFEEYVKRRITITEKENTHQFIEKLTGDNVDSQITPIYMKQDENGQPLLEFQDFTVDFATIQNQKLRFDAHCISIIGNFDDTFCSAAIQLFRQTKSSCETITFQPSMSKLMCPLQKLDEFLEASHPRLFAIQSAGECSLNDFYRYAPAIYKIQYIQYCDITLKNFETEKSDIEKCEQESDSNIETCEGKSEDSWSVVSAPSASPQVSTCSVL